MKAVVEISDVEYFQEYKNLESRIHTSVFLFRIRNLVVKCVTLQKCTRIPVEYFVYVTFINNRNVLVTEMAGLYRLPFLCKKRIYFNADSF